MSPRILTPSPKEIHEQLRVAFQKRIPTGQAIAARAVERALSGHETDSKWIKRNFSNLVENVQLDAYREYLEAEGIIGGGVLAEVLMPLVGRDPKPEDFAAVLTTYFVSLDRFFLGLTQGRRPRAGNAFEILIREVFERLGYPFTRQAIINGQPDFLLPSVGHYGKNPMDCIIFTVKRTLRERWRQIVTEGTRGLGFFLATIDEDVAQRDLKDMLAARINLVVPARIKTIRPDYQTAVNVITFEDFFEYHLDPAMKRWKANKVI
jgi:hypothetical protein